MLLITHHHLQSMTTYSIFRHSDLSSQYCTCSAECLLSSGSQNAFFKPPSSPCSSCFALLCSVPHCKAPLKLICWHQQPPPHSQQHSTVTRAHSTNPDQRETTHTHAASGPWTQTWTRNTCLHMDMKTHTHQAQLHRGDKPRPPWRKPPLFFKTHGSPRCKKGGVQSLNYGYLSLDR